MIPAATRRLPHILLVLTVLVALGGCVTVVPTQEPATPDAPTAIPQETSASQESLPPTATPGPTMEIGAAPGGLRTPVPIIYKMFDYGTDYQHLAPELGPVGSIMWFDWNRINPAPGEYNWSVIDNKLALEENLLVTLPDGTEIAKPVVIQIMASISGSTGSHSFTDYTPTWVYDIIDSENPGDPRPIVGGRPVGYKLEGCETEAAVPMYGNATWRRYHYDMVRAFGERYDGHPQVTSVVVNTGLDGETQPVKDLSCPWNTYLDEQASGARYGFQTFINELLPVYREAFPTTTLYINNAPGGSSMRKMTSDLAASMDPPIGLKHSGMWVDLDSHQGYGTFYGSWDLVKAYSMTLPIWLESPFGLGSAEHRYWSIIAGLHYHPDAIDLHPEYLTQSDPAWFEFAVDHLGKTIQDTPSVWTVLRDAEYPLVSWGDNGVSGHMGDWTFWLSRLDGVPQSETKVLLREEMPAAQDHVYSRQARTTQQDTNNPFMSFDIEDAYPYVNMKPIAEEGGNVHYKVQVTILNRGEDTFALQYRNWQGDMVSQSRTKGPELGAVDDWVVVTFDIEDAYFANNMPGDADFRISCERDGDEIIHMVLVQGGWGVPPPPTPTVPPTETPLPSATARATSTQPVPTSSTPGQQTPEPDPTDMPGGQRFDPVVDTYLDQWAPADSHDDEPELFARQGDVKAPMWQFDLTSIPSHAAVDSAVLQVRTGARSNASYLNLAAFKVFRDWDPATTWRQATSRYAWAVPGCNDPVQDRSAVFVSDVWLTEEQGWVDLDLTSLVREWVRDPESNHGMIMKASGSVSVEYALYAQDHDDADNHPRLLVAWRNLTPSPTATLPAPTAGPLDPIEVIIETDGLVDSTLDSWAPEVNRGADQTLLAYQGGTQAPILRFDTSQIPAGVSIKEATLHLYAVGRSSVAPLTLSIAGVQRDWDDDQVTWIRTTSSEAWAQPGAREVGADRSAMLYDTQTLASMDAWIAWTITDLVQRWASDPAGNNGLLILGEGADPVQYSLASSEYADKTLRPRLHISYVLATPTSTCTPTPYGAPTATPGVEPTTGPSPEPTATEPTYPEPTDEPGDYPASHGEVWRFQQGVDGYDGAADTLIDSQEPDMAHGQDEIFLLAETPTNAALLRFDLGERDAPSELVQASLVVQVVGSPAAADVTMAVYPVKRGWDEGSATWIKAETGQIWESPGAGGPNDRASEPLVRVSVPAGATSISLDLGEAVAAWLKDPGANHGLLIVAEGLGEETLALASAKHPDASVRPMLQVVFAPEHGALGIVAWLAIAAGIVVVLVIANAISRARQEPEQRVE